MTSSAPRRSSGASPNAPATDCRPGLRRPQAPQLADRARLRGRHSTQLDAREPARPRPRRLPELQPHRAHALQVQGLPQNRHPMRQARRHLPLRRLQRRRFPVVVQSSPGPRGLFVDDVFGKPGKHRRRHSVPRRSGGTGRPGPGRDRARALLQFAHVCNYGLFLEVNCFKIFKSPNRVHLDPGCRRNEERRTEIQLIAGFRKEMCSNRRKRCATCWAFGLVCFGARLDATLLCGRVPGDRPPKSLGSASAMTS